jgi:type II restriction enzyme
MKSANRGEWSEFYAFLKMIMEKELSVAGPNLEKTDVSYPIISILRGEGGDVKKYDLTGDGEIKLTHGDKETVLKFNDLKNGVKEVFGAIKSSSGSGFTIEAAEKWMGRLECEQIKADSSRKSDIGVVIHDFEVGRETEIDFSIKSNLGGKPTLLNASSQTNFIFRVDGFTGDIDTNNEYKYYAKKINNIKQEGGELNFVDMASDVFEENLRKIDTYLPEILSRYVLLKYSGVSSDIEELTSVIAEEQIEISDFTLSEEDLQYKIKGLLQASGLGMQPATPWGGKLNVNGGYIVVKESGDLVCYHLHNIDAFRDYLFENTKLETAKRSRHKFGKLYKENGQTYLKLNLQIRFSN